MEKFDEFKSVCRMIDKRKQISKWNSSKDSLNKLIHLLDKKEKIFLTIKEVREHSFISFVFLLLGIMGTSLFFAYPNEAIYSFTIAFGGFGIFFVVSNLLIKHHSLVRDISIEKNKNMEFFLHNDVKPELSELRNYLDRTEKTLSKIDKKTKSIKDDLSMEDYKYLISRGDELSHFELDVLEKWFLDFRKTNKDAKKGFLQSLILNQNEDINLLNF